MGRLVETWATIILTGPVLALSLLLASESIPGLLVQSVIIGCAFLVGYFVNAKTMSVWLLLLTGIPLVLLAPAFALSANGAYLGALVVVFVSGTCLLSSALGTALRRNIWPRPGDHPDA